MREENGTNDEYEIDFKTEKENLGGVEMNKEKNGKNYMYHVELVGGKAFWGVLFLIGAIALLAGQLGYLDFAGFSFWTIFWTVILIGTLLEGIVKVKVANVLFSLAFLVIVHDELLGLEAITPWPVLGAALLGSIGIKMIFPKLGGSKESFVTVNGVPLKKGESVSEESRDGAKISYENAFGESVKYVSGDVEKVNIENSFGSMQVYFSDAFPVNGQLTINVDNSFGNTVLYIPSVWKVIVKRKDVFLGSVKEVGQCSADGLNEAYVKADVAFGGVEIRYI